MEKDINKPELYDFFKYGPSPSSFGIIIAKLLTDSITTDILTINWACPRLVYKSNPNSRKALAEKDKKLKWNGNQDSILQR